MGESRQAKATDRKSVVCAARFSLSGDSLEVVHVWPERPGDNHTAVCLLVIFQNCHPGTPDSETGTVKRVNKFDFSFRIWTKRILARRA